MNNCLIEYFGLETLVERNDCENCPFKEKSKCREAQKKILDKARESLSNYMNCKDRKSINEEEKVIFNKREEVKKLLKEMGVKVE